MSGERGESFRTLPSRQVDGFELTALRYKLATAARTARRLSDLVDRWRADTDLTTTLVRPAGSSTRVEVVVESSRLFPHDHWATLAGGFGHQARSTLDNLNDLLTARFATGRYNARRIAFPIAADEGEWDRWLRTAPPLPGWLIARYRDVQPFAGPYIGLRGLQWFNNKDKHQWAQVVRVSLTGLLASSTFRVEGLIGDGELDLRLDPVSNVLERGSRRVVVGTFDVGRTILDSPGEAANELEVGLMFDMGHAEYTLKEVREIPARIGELVDYVALGDRHGLRRYRAPVLSEGPRAAEEPGRAQQQ